ncbi:hypothetical protein NEMBOFW57_004080 [Staphylotrichum longicolle]|uniref:Cupin type-2 domain-containing protein n=1 Tax=Staphylotrichum longicolle TaxID=669026 RepID=A0AAD4I043_9PEZI|nr:hypothetical protein NEMBOFW57_004080 [Staphylotrichum longicolle]
MASLLPLIQDILPMILPASVSVTRAADILPPEPETQQPTEEKEGKAAAEVRVISRNAVVDKTDKMCTSETIIYTVSGKGVLLSQPKGDEEEPERHELGPGDFAFVPAWTEHQAVNESDTDFHLVVIRSGGSPVEVHLTDWGGPQVKDPPKQ